MALIQRAFSDIITFSRSSNATRVGPTGLVEYAPHNLALQSQTFDNASWTKTRCSITANAIAAPDGTVTADKLVEDTTASNTHFIVQGIAMGGSVDSSRFAFSIFAKAGERSRIRMFDNNQSSAGDTTFNLSTGTVVTGGGTITSVGNGWYRCTIYPLKDFSTTSTVRILLDNGSTDTYTGDGTSGIYLWGAQLSVGTRALDYVPTTSAAVYGPRFDYDPVTLAAKGLLIEESRTNLLTYSEQFDNAAWFTYLTTVTANTVVSPDGTTNADTFTTSSGGGSVFQVSIGSAGQTISVSCYVKAGTSSSFSLDVAQSGNGRTANFNVATGTVTGVSNLGAGTYATGGTASIESVGNGWYRCSFNGVYITGAVNPGLVIFANGSLYVWGAQLEAGSFATSYIPTLASTVTRSADLASVDTLTPWMNQTEGTIFAEYLFYGADALYNNTAVMLTDGTENNYEAILGYNPAYGWIQSGGATSAGLSSGGSTAINTNYKAAFAFKANDFAFSLNGGATVTDTSGTVPTVTQMLLGRRVSGSKPLHGYLRRVAFYPRRLTNAELQALTA